jgi:hypothetical protein
MKLNERLRLEVKVGFWLMILPFLPMFIIAYPITLLSKCRLGAGEYESCLLFGREVSGFMNTLNGFGWFGLITIPSSIFIILVGAILRSLNKSNKR